MKKISDFLSKKFLFLEVKISTYLNRRVFVMSLGVCSVWQVLAVCMKKAGVFCYSLSEYIILCIPRPYMLHGSSYYIYITKTCLFKYTENFTTKKWKFSDKKFWYFSYFCSKIKNIDFGYSLEPPRRGGSNEYPQSMLLGRIRKIMYTPVNPSFTI